MQQCRYRGTDTGVENWEITARAQRDTGVETGRVQLTELKIAATSCNLRQGGHLGRLVGQKSKIRNLSPLEIHSLLDDYTQIQKHKYKARWTDSGHMGIKNGKI